MSNRDRRAFIKRGAAALTAGPFAARRGISHARDVRQRDKTSIGPRRGQIVSGVHAYTDRLSVRAGETVRLHVSSTVPYRLSICRLGLQVDDPAGDEVLYRFPEADPQPQSIHPGSFVAISKALPAMQPMAELSLECWVRPWSVDRWAGMITQYDYPDACGCGLFLGPAGTASFYVGDGRAYREECSAHSEQGRMKPQCWHHVAGVWDGQRSSLWIDGVDVASVPCSMTAAAGPAHLRLGAYGQRGTTEHYLDGDLAMPVIYARAQLPDEIRSRHRDRGFSPGKGNRILGCWPLDEEHGAEIADVSGNGRTGTIINHGTWMIGGPGFDADVRRFGDYQPARDPQRGHALRLASDDLYDCGWSATHAYCIPDTAKPGIYVARFDYSIDGAVRRNDTTFIVNRHRNRAQAPILVLAATNTWRAYSGAPFSRDLPPGNHVCGTGGFPNSEGNPPAFCFYRNHAAGQGSYQLGLRMPWPPAGPHVLYGDKQRTAYSHLARADRFLHIWLERSGYAFDVVSDLDLHQHPDVLQGYQTVFINGHSEYWSIPMLEGLRKYLEEQDGNVVCLSGNSLFWRVSFSDDGSIIECRKVDAPGRQMPSHMRGECWHAQDGLRGGLLTECGYPGWELIGLATMAFNNPSEPSDFGPFRVEQPNHFLFHRPNRLNFRRGDPIGRVAGASVPAANGHEVDVRVSTLRQLLQQPVPNGAVHPADPEGIELIAAGRDWPQDSKSTFDYYMRLIDFRKVNQRLGGELIYWERPQGGRVFNAGAIGAGWALEADPRFQDVMINVLHHFGVPERVVS